MARSCVLAHPSSLPDGPSNWAAPSQKEPHPSSLSLAECIADFRSASSSLGAACFLSRTVVGTTSQPPKWIKPQLTCLADEAPAGGIQSTAAAMDEAAPLGSSSLAFVSIAPSSLFSWPRWFSLRWQSSRLIATIISFTAYCVSAKARLSINSVDLFESALKAWGERDGKADSTSAASFGSCRRSSAAPSSDGTATCAAHFGATSGLCAARRCNRPPVRNWCVAPAGLVLDLVV
jgi:hypothetical protein